MNKSLLLVFIFFLLILIILSNNIIDNFDKKYLSMILATYLFYIILDEIPNFEYYTVNYDN